MVMYSSDFGSIYVLHGVYSTVMPILLHLRHNFTVSVIVGRGYCSFFALMTPEYSSQLETALNGQL